jgi:hypothetical protein
VFLENVNYCLRDGYEEIMNKKVEEQRIKVERNKKRRSK